VVNNENELAAQGKVVSARVSQEVYDQVKASGVSTADLLKIALGKVKPDPTSSDIAESIESDPDVLAKEKKLRLALMPAATISCFIAACMVRRRQHRSVIELQRAPKTDMKTALVVSSGSYDGRISSQLSRSSRQGSSKTTVRHLLTFPNTFAVCSLRSRFSRSKLAASGPPLR